MGLYDTHSFEWSYLRKVLICTGYTNSETICIPSPKYCLSLLYVFKFMKLLYNAIIIFYVNYFYFRTENSTYMHSMSPVNEQKIKHIRDSNQQPS